MATGEDYYSPFMEDYDRYKNMAVSAAGPFAASATPPAETPATTTPRAGNVGTNINIHYPGDNFWQKGIVPIPLAKPGAGVIEPIPTAPPGPLELTPLSAGSITSNPNAPAPGGYKWADTAGAIANGFNWFKNRIPTGAEMAREFTPSSPSGMGYIKDYVLPGITTSPPVTLGMATMEGYDWLKNNANNTNLTNLGVGEEALYGRPGGEGVLSRAFNWMKNINFPSLDEYGTLTNRPDYVPPTYTQPVKPAPVTTPTPGGEEQGGPYWNLKNRPTTEPPTYPAPYSGRYAGETKPFGDIVSEVRQSLLDAGVSRGTTPFVTGTESSNPVIGWRFNPQGMSRLDRWAARFMGPTGEWSPGMAVPGWEPVHLGDKRMGERREPLKGLDQMLAEGAPGIIGHAGVLEAAREKAASDIEQAKILGAAKVKAYETAYSPKYDRRTATVKAITDIIKSYPMGTFTDEDAKRLYPIVEGLMDKVYGTQPGATTGMTPRTRPKEITVQGRDGKMHKLILDENGNYVKAP